MLVGGVAGRAVTPGSRRISTLLLPPNERILASKIQKSDRKRQRLVLSNPEWADASQSRQTAQRRAYYSTQPQYPYLTRQVYPYDTGDLTDSPDDMTSGATSPSPSGPPSPRSYEVELGTNIRLPDSEPSSDEEEHVQAKPRVENPFFDEFTFFPPIPAKSTNDETLSAFERLSLTPALDTRRRSRPPTPPPLPAPAKAAPRSIKSLSPSWKERISSLMQTTDRTTVFAKLPRFQLTRHDFGTVLPQQGDNSSAWLNDEIINAYLFMTVAYGLRAHDALPPPPNQKAIQPPPPAYHAFNSFFYSTLRQKGPSAVARWAARAKIGKDALLQTTTVFIPINQSAHWTLLLLRPRERKIEYYDSLGGSATPYIGAVKQWLAMELGKELWKEEEWSVDDVPSPTQNNSSDCGVFVCMNAKMTVLGRELITAYSQKDMQEIRWRMCAELVNGGFTGDFEP